MTSCRTAPSALPGRRASHRSPWARALAELDRIWQRGPAGQIFLLVSASSAFLTTTLVLALGLASLTSG